MKHIVLIMIFMLGLPSGAWAYSSLYGSGHYGGAQPCPYKLSRYEKSIVKKQNKIDQLNYNIGTEEDGILELEDVISEMESDLEEMFRDSSVSDYLANYARDLTYGDNVCRSTSRPVAAGSSGCASVQNAGLDEDFCQVCHDTIRSYEKSNEKFLGEKLCTKDRLNKGERKKDCEDLLKDLFADNQDLDESKDALSEMKSELRSLNRKLKKAERDQRRGRTEGGYKPPCDDCDDNKVYDFVKNIGMPLLAGYIGYKGVKYVSDTNKELGYPGTPSAGLIGGMMALNGIYGAGASGYGSGAYGCANMAGNVPGQLAGSLLGIAALTSGAQLYGGGSGAFGYPQGYYNQPHGGGIFNTGHLPGGGFPGYNFNANANFGINFPNFPGSQFPSYPGSQFPGGQFPGSQFPGGQFPGGQFPGSQFPGGQFPGSQFPGSQFPGSQFPGSQFPGSQFPGSQFPRGQFPGGQFPGGQFPGGQFPGGQFPGGQYPTAACLQFPCNVGGANSQFYQQQMQLYHQQTQYQLAIQAENDNKYRQWLELNQQMQALQVQMGQIYSSTGNYNLGISGSIGVSGSVGVSGGINTGVPGATPPYFPEGTQAPGTTTTQPQTGAPVRGR